MDSNMKDSNLKEEAPRLIDELPQNSTWDDLMHKIYVRQAIEVGLADSEAGRTTDVEEVRARFKLPSESPLTIWWLSMITLRGTRRPMLYG
jgi:hypothetical protein